MAISRGKLVFILAILVCFCFMTKAFEAHEGSTKCHSHSQNPHEECKDEGHEDLDDDTFKVVKNMAVNVKTSEDGDPSSFQDDFSGESLVILGH